MAFCAKCGTQTQDEAELCPECNSTGQERTQANDIEANKIMAVIAYIGLLVIVPLATGKYKDSQFLKFHVNQALIFCIGYVVVMVLGFIPFIGFLLGSILGLGIAVLQIICIISAIKGETKSFPVISEIKIIK